MKTPETLRSLSRQSRPARASSNDGERAQISLSRSAFASLLNSAFYPNPDDSGTGRGPFGPYGPGGPVLSRLLEVALNPQPLPPGPDPYRELAWVALNPQPLPPGPDPYRAAMMARAVITRAATQADFTQLLGNKHAENGIIIVGGRVRDVIDDWCGTPVPGHHGPGPHFISLLAAGAQFQLAADSMRDNELHEVFAGAAKKLFKAGLARMEEG
jgi:hypothetical protein